MGYRSIAGKAFAEKVIEKSHFLAYARHVEGEEAARAALAEVCAMHPLATHVCYAFIADKAGNLQRFSDMGEPQGTAGMPILGVIKAQELRETLVAVVRYFGGIKLGAGGLTRAYAGSASAALAEAKICNFEMCEELALSVEYADVNAAMRFLEGREILSKNFAERAEFTVAVKESEAETFKARARDFFNGKIQMTAGKRYYFPFAAEE